MVDFAGVVDRPSGDGADPAQLFGDVEAGLWPLEAEPFELLAQQLRDRPVAVPLAVGRDDVPRRRLCAAALERVGVGGHVVVPQRAVLEVVRVVLPVLGRVAETGDQPCSLLLGRDVQVALDDPRAALGQLGLEAVDGVVTADPRALVGKLAHAHGEHVLVVRAVEDAELAGARELLPDPPQEVVAQLLRRRAAEARGVHAGRVARPDDVADGAALAGGVEPLQHEQHAARPALAALGEELLLERRQPLRVLRLRLVRAGLALLEAGGRARVELAQVDRARRRAQEGADALGHSRAECRVMVLTREYVDIPVGGRAMRTFVAAPRADGPHPGVVFYTDIFQLTEPSLRWAVRLAGYGYLVAVPEIYHRIEPAGTVLDFD